MCLTVFASLQVQCFKEAFFLVNTELRKKCYIVYVRLYKLLQVFTLLQACISYGVLREEYFFPINS